MYKFVLSRERPHKIKWGFTVYAIVNHARPYADIHEGEFSLYSEK